MQVQTYCLFARAVSLFASRLGVCFFSLKPRKVFSQGVGNRRVSKGIVEKIFNHGSTVEMTLNSVRIDSVNHTGLELL